jgi:hypothetical protein
MIIKLLFLLVIVAYYLGMFLGPVFAIVLLSMWWAKLGRSK